MAHRRVGSLVSFRTSISTPRTHRGVDSVGTMADVQLVSPQSSDTSATQSKGGPSSEVKHAMAQAEALLQAEQMANKSESRANDANSKAAEQKHRTRKRAGFQQFDDYLGKADEGDTLDEIATIDDSAVQQRSDLAADGDLPTPERTRPNSEAKFHERYIRSITDRTGGSTVRIKTITKCAGTVLLGLVALIMIWVVGAKRHVWAMPAVVHRTLHSPSPPKPSPPPSPSPPSPNPFPWFPHGFPPQAPAPPPPAAAPPPPSSKAPGHEHSQQHHCGRHCRHIRPQEPPPPLPPPPPPHSLPSSPLPWPLSVLPRLDVAEGEVRELLNHRFNHGRASNNLEEVGVLVHTFDGFLNDTAPWEVATSGWHAKFSTVLSASIVNLRKAGAPISY